MILNITDTKYRAMPDKVWSSMLKDIYEKSDLHISLPTDPKLEEVFKFGTNAHMHILEPEVFESKVKVIPNYLPIAEAHIEKYGANCEIKDSYSMTAEYREQKAEFEASCEHNISRSDMDKLNAMKGALIKSNEKKFNGYLRGGDAEVTITLDEFSTSMEKVDGCDVFHIYTPVKARLDYVKVIEERKTVYITDYKTCQSASPRDFPYKVRSMKYDMQAAFYSDVAQQHYGPEYKIKFMWLAQEKLYPFANKWYIASDKTLEEGRMKYTSVMERADIVIRGGSKIGYGDQIDSL